MPLDLAGTLADLTIAQRGDLTIIVRNAARGNGLTDGGGPGHLKVTTSVARRLVAAELAIERRDSPARRVPRFYPTGRGVALVIADLHHLDDDATDDLIARCDRYTLAELRDLVLLTFDDVA